ncbi:hypothetical protein QAD02_006901 [Eretmocerus hayati]|uniref:Uncharacterized protein n=1 Tax=Eretmocerus hayati TaxID=131215 RepID=A0ACC2N4J7_9HYME|nr:hypothetical protein QAD02_006901 [Eretmocerus hayati]
MALLLAHYGNDKHQPSIYYDGVFGVSSTINVVKSVREIWWSGSRKEAHNVTKHSYVGNFEYSMLSHDLVEINELLAEPLKVLYPKLLIVVDYGYFKLFNKDVTEILKYLSIFWNAVNLRYSKLSTPRVNIVITGVIIEHDEYGLRYIYESRNPLNMSQLDLQIFLSKAGEYFSGEDFARDSRKFGNFDSVITISSLETGRIKGQALIGEVCSKRFNTAFVKDRGNFDGIQVAVHELGHLLNMPHDGENDAYHCGPDSYSNNVSTHMAAVNGFAERYVWSKCSEKILEKFSW